MTQRRVAITGAGAVSAAGCGAEALMDAACEGVGCTRPISLFDAGGFACRVAGEVADFKARNFVPKSYRKAVKVMARDIQLAVAAADLAVRDAGLTTKGIDEAAVDVDGARFACNIGAGLICAELEELGAALTTALDDEGRFDIRQWGDEGMTNLTPLWLLKYLPNMLACHVTIIHDMRGPSNTITCGEASGLLSIGEAADHVRRGAADLAIAGGAESRVNPLCILRQDKLGRLAPSGDLDPSEVCRPFDAAHRGTVIGEGGGLLILEDVDHAAGRDASVYAEVVGFAGATDPVGMDPDRRHVGNVGLAAANALARAGIEPGQLDLVVAQGTGVPHEDAMEAEAISALLAGADAAVVSATGLVGNCQAGASGVSAALAAMALKRQQIPASTNFTAPADGCDGLTVPRAAADATIDYALVQAFSHTGQSAAMVLKRPEAEA